MTGAHFEVFPDSGGEYRFRLRAANGEIVATSEGYGSAADAERGVEDAIRAVHAARIPVGGDDVAAAVEHVGA